MEPQQFGVARQRPVMAGAQTFQRIGMIAARIHGREHCVTGVGGACQRRAAEIAVDGGFKGCLLYTSDAADE